MIARNTIQGVITSFLQIMSASQDVYQQLVPTQKTRIELGCLGFPDRKLKITRKNWKLLLSFESERWCREQTYLNIIA